MSQLSLLDPPPATYSQGTLPGSARHSATSREAAASIADEVGIRQTEVLKALVVLRTATADEIAERLGRHPYVVRPRVTELQKRGLLTLTGETRATKAGRKASVVRLTRQGVEYIAESVHKGNATSNDAGSARENRSQD